MSTDWMKTTALAPWYGSNRMLGKHVGEALRGCEWVGVVFAGGMSEVAHIDARTIAVNDKHNHVVNLAACVADKKAHVKLMEKLDGVPFHPNALKDAQEACRLIESDFAPPKSTLGMAEGFNAEWAAAYFVCAWMARNGTAGEKDEFKAGISMRWEAGGGDSAVRFRSATESISGWHKVMRRCTFTCLDCFDFLAKCKDRNGFGIYSDAPWPEDGDGYKHTFTEAQQRRLALVLSQYGKTRVVIRFGDHPLIRELYPLERWTWQEFSGRTAANKAKTEVLIVNKVEA